MTHDARELAAALGARAEEVCRRLLPRGRRNGRYWTVGGLDGAPGRSMWVRLRPPGTSGKWVDAATGEHGDLLDLIRHRLGTASLGPALEEARAILALPRAPCRVPGPPPTTPAGRTAGARRLWDACRPVAGTHAEAYLRARAIESGGFSALRFHPRLHYRWDETRLEALPALVAAVTTCEGVFTAIHRTWLDPCLPAKAPVPAPKKALGPVHGHAVRFAGAPGRASLLVVGEGIETVLGVLTALPELHGAAALSAPGLAAFAPPAGSKQLLIARDNDAAGERAASLLERRCRELGLDTRTLIPEHGDFNDDLRALGAAELAERITAELTSPARTQAASPRASCRERERGNARHQPEFRRASREHSLLPGSSIQITRSHPMADTTSLPTPICTFTRLRSGAWGVRVPEAVHRLAPGQRARVAVRRRSGEVSSETVVCFWRGVSRRTGEVVALCEMVRPDPVGRDDGPDSP